MEKLQCYPGKSPSRYQMYQDTPDEACCQPCSKGRKLTGRGRSRDSRSKMNIRRQSLCKSNEPVTSLRPGPSGMANEKDCCQHDRHVEPDHTSTDRSRGRTRSSSIESRLNMNSRMNRLYESPVTSCGHGQYGTINRDGIVGPDHTSTERSRGRTRTRSSSIESRLKINSRMNRLYESPVTSCGPGQYGLMNHDGIVGPDRTSTERSRGRTRSCSFDSRLKINSRMNRLYESPLTSCGPDPTDHRCTGRSQSVDAKMMICHPVTPWIPELSGMENGNVVCRTVLVPHVICCAVHEQRSTVSPPQISVGERDDGLVSSYTGHIPKLQYNLGESYGTSCKRLRAERLQKEREKCCLYCPLED